MDTNFTRTAFSDATARLELDRPLVPVSHEGVRLTEDQRTNALARMERQSLRNAPLVDLQAELEQRCNTITDLRFDLLCLDPDEAEERARIDGGIAYELNAMQLIVSELKRRRQRGAHCSRSEKVMPEPDLHARFARLRESRGQDGFADVVMLETSRQVQLKGKNYVCRCPFHSGGEERTPSFTIYSDLHAYCFGCGWHGDLPDFVAKTRGIRQVEALLLLESGAL